MKLLLLPISTRQTLLYCAQAAKASATENTPPLSLFGRFAAKATATGKQGWAEWEAKPKGWKKQVTVYGNSLVRQIPHQEWALKAIPPLNAQRQRDISQADASSSIECLYPEDVLSASSVKALLHQLSVARQPFHRKSMWQSAAIAPLMLPFAIIPM
jgi:hypothetical protein